MVLMDVCCWCSDELNPLAESTRMIIGSKTKLEWYVCKKCQTLAKQGMKAITDFIAEQDQQFYEEDLEEEQE